MVVVAVVVVVAVEAGAVVVEVGLVVVGPQAPRQAQWPHAGRRRADHLIRPTPDRTPGRPQADPSSPHAGPRQDADINLADSTKPARALGRGKQP